MISLKQGSPTSGLWTSTFCQISGSIRLEIQCIINAMHLNHLETTLPPPSPRKNCLPQYWSPMPKRLGTAALFFFFFDGRIIALQRCVGFCHTTWISHKYPLLLQSPSHPPPPSHPSVITEHQAELPELYSNFPLAITIHFTHGSVSTSMLLYQIIPPSPSPTMEDWCFKGLISKYSHILRSLSSGLQQMNLVSNTSP